MSDGLGWRIVRPGPDQPGRTEPAALSRRHVDLWREVHNERSVAVLRCAAGGRRCRARLGEVWATREGLLLQYFWHLPEARETVDVRAEDAGLIVDAIAAGAMPDLRWEPGHPTALRSGSREEFGTLALVDVDAYWHGADVGCRRHGTARLDRDLLRSAAEKGARTDRRVDVWIDTTA